MIVLLLQEKLSFLEFFQKENANKNQSIIIHIHTYTYLHKTVIGCVVHIYK